MNKKLLRSIMVLHGDNNATLSEYLGISKQSFSAKINENKSEFKKEEIAKICEKYDLTAEQIKEIFFN